MKKLISIIISVIFVTCFSAASAHADRKTMEGFMLGTGVAILGAAIYHGIQNNPRPEYDRHHSSRYDNHGHGKQISYGYHQQYRQPAPRGHWEIERIWVEPAYETKWNPGHYDHNGEWVNGRNEKFQVQNGYWHEEKVWVNHY